MKKSTRHQEACVNSSIMVKKFIIKDAIIYKGKALLQNSKAKFKYTDGFAFSKIKR